MRKIITTLCGIGLALAAALHWSRWVLDMTGTIQTAIGIPGLTDALIDFIGSRPGLTTDLFPAVLVVAVLVSLTLAFVWPHAIHDWLGRKRLVCDFDPKIAGCVADGVALPRSLATTTTGPSTSYTIMLSGFPIEPTVTTSEVRLPANFAGLAIGERRRYFRLRVRPAKRYEIKRCAAALISIKSDDGKVVYEGGPIALTIAPAERADPEHKDIESGREEFVDVIYATETGAIGIGSRYAPHSISWAEAFGGPGLFRITVIVNAAECQPVERVLLLNWSGDWQTTSADQVAGA
jgi:hypothetical protein